MKKLIIVALLFSNMFINMAANAGIYGDDLARCLVESSTEDDKIKLVKWMFSAMSLHPSVKDMASVSDEDRDASNKDMANLMTEMLIIKCLDEARKAVKFEGPLALQSGFQVFGQVAGQDLFSNPEVAAGMSGLEKYLDNDTIDKKLGIPKR